MSLSSWEVLGRDMMFRFAFVLGLLRPDKEIVAVEVWRANKRQRRDLAAEVFQQDAREFMSTLCNSFTIPRGPLKSMVSARLLNKQRSLVGLNLLVSP